MLDRDWVVSEFKLDENQFLADKPDLKEDLIKTLIKHTKAFEGTGSKTEMIGQGEAGRTTWVQCRVQLKPGCEAPVSVRQRKLNPHDLEQLRQQLKMWLAAGFIERANSEWSSAILAVKKKTVQRNVSASISDRLMPNANA